MIYLNTWNNLFDGKYGNQKLDILYKDDIFVSILRLRDQNNSLIQVYKAFVVKGDAEMFTNTLPYPALLYHKHISVGEKGNFRYLLLHTETELVDNNTLSYHVDKKISDLNKMVSSVVAVTKSYNIKLISLKLASEDETNYFFSNPQIVKTLTNVPLSLDFSSPTALDKLILGKKKDVLVTTTLDLTDSVGIFNGTINERVSSAKVFCENSLLSARTVFVFDPTGLFNSLAYPNSDSTILDKFDLKMDPFGFPVKTINFFDIKIPLAIIPLNVFVTIFKFSNTVISVIKKVYTNNLVTIEDLINNVKNSDFVDINEFEKKRILAKLNIINVKYKNIFGKTDVSILYKQRYKHIGSVKILNIDYKNPFAVYYVSQIINLISLNLKNEATVVLPESKKLFNNPYIGPKVLSLLNDNNSLSSVVTSKHHEDFNLKNVFKVNLHIVKENDAVIHFPNRDPMRLLLRPTFTAHIIKFIEPKTVVRV